MGSHRTHRTQQRKPHLNRTSSRRTLGLQKSTNMGNKRKKFSCTPRSKKAASNRRASVYEESRADGDTIHKAAGNAAHENRSTARCPRGFRAMLRQSVARAGQKPCTRSRCGIGNWRVAMRFFFPQRFRWRRACLGRNSSSLRLKLSR